MPQEKGKWKYTFHFRKTLDRTLWKVRVKWQFRFTILKSLSHESLCQHSYLLVNIVAKFKIDSFSFFPIHANFKILQNVVLVFWKLNLLYPRFLLLVVHSGNSCANKENKIINFGNSSFISYMFTTIKTM